MRDDPHPSAGCQPGPVRQADTVTETLSWTPNCQQVETGEEPRRGKRKDEEIKMK